jgi:hypothetical protein
MSNTKSSNPDPLTYYDEVLSKYDFPKNYNPDRSNKHVSSYPKAEVINAMRKKFEYDSTMMETVIAHMNHYINAEKAYEAQYFFYENLKKSQSKKKSPVSAKSKTKRCPPKSYRQEDGSCGPEKQKRTKKK